MSELTTTKEYALSIYKGELPGLFALNFKGNYGSYVKTEVIFAENCQLFGFIVYDSQNQDADDFMFGDEGVDGDEITLYTYDISVKAEYDIRRVS